MLRHTASHPARLAVRIASQRARAFHAATYLYKAEFFRMPAMSPTMEKGGVADWKFKEGESFSSGDVLLEVETDKAQIDVEAQDDGVVAKILIQNGATDIPVGTPIAILAEQGDDLATLELPTEAESKPAAPTAKKTEDPKTTEQAPKQTPTNTTADSISSTANPQQVFFPSVASLLLENNISREDALSKIKATGANGRLLKGDVLAFLGKISQDSVNKIASFIQEHSHLDLSNIERLKITPKQTSKQDEAKKDEVRTSKPVKPEPKTITRTFDLGELLDFQASAEEKGFESFSIKEYIIGASTRAEKFAYQPHPKQSDLYDPIFEDLIAPTTNTERFQIKLDIPVESTIKTLKNPLDVVDFFHEQDDILFDELTSKKAEAPSQFTVKVTLNSKVLDAEEKAELYLQKLERYIHNLN